MCGYTGGLKDGVCVCVCDCMNTTLISYTSKPSGTAVTSPLLPFDKVALMCVCVRVSAGFGIDESATSGLHKVLVSDTRTHTYTWKINKQTA